MARVIRTLHLSDFQKKVMVIIKSAPTPQVAFEELQKQPPDERNNIVGARNLLQKLGLINVGAGTLEITQEGEQVMADEYLIDEMGELTPEALSLVDDASGNKEADGDMSGDDFGDTEPQQPETSPFESLSLVRLIHDQSKFLID